MKILIVEDESSIANRIERFVREILGDRLIILDIRESYEAAREYIEHSRIDILLLDLNLSGKDGFELLKGFLAEAIDTIVISGYKDKALEAFEYGVIDFIAKPFDKSRLEKALNRTLNKKLKSTIHAKNIVVKKQGRIVIIPINKITYIKGANVYSEIHLISGRKELSNKTLDHLERILAQHFVRIHKSFIVDIRICKELIILPGSKYQILIETGETLPVGRTRYKALKEAYFTL